MNSNFRMVLRSISVVLGVEGMIMLAPYLCAVHTETWQIAKAFAYVGVTLILVGVLLNVANPHKKVRLKQKDAYVITIVGWAAVCIAGAVPYWISGQGYSISQGIFESVAGWTTTGAWAIDPTQMPKPFILWKCMTNWLGEMGLMMMIFSFVPVIGNQGARVIAQEESSGIYEKMMMRFEGTQRYLVYIYVALSLIEFALLLPSGLPVFDCATNTMSSISTAGLVNRTGELAICFSAYVKFIITLFTVLGSLNIMIIFFLVKGYFDRVVKNLELRCYLGLLLLSAAAVALVLILSGTYDSPLEAISDALVQCCSYGSTCGFWAADINGWPTLTKIILLVLLVVGGCSNSTGGSIKMIRFIIFIKIVRRGAYKRIHPRAVRPIKLQGEPISAAMVSLVSSFVLIFFVAIIAGGILLSFENLDIESTLCASIACVTNNGTCFGVVSQGLFTDFSSFGKIAAAFLMICGKLEIYTVAMLFSRTFWNLGKAR